jgi:hypothetical protein
MLSPHTDITPGSVSLQNGDSLPGNQPFPEEAEEQGKSLDLQG